MLLTDGNRKAAQQLWLRKVRIHREAPPDAGASAPKAATAKPQPAPARARAVPKLETAAQLARRERSQIRLRQKHLASKVWASTTPLSDRPLHTPPPTPCPIMGHTQASLCDRPCPGSELRSLTPCPPPSPERGLPQPQRATPAPSPQLIPRAPSGFTSVLFCRVVCSLPLVVPTLPSP